MNNLHPELEYKTSQGIGDDLDYFYNISIINGVVLYEHDTYNPISHYKSNGGKFHPINVELIQSDLRYIAGVNAHVYVER